MESKKTEISAEETNLRYIYNQVVLPWESRGSEVAKDIENVSPRAKAIVVHAGKSQIKIDGILIYNIAASDIDAWDAETKNALARELASIFQSKSTHHNIKSAQKLENFRNTRNLNASIPKSVEEKTAEPAFELTEAAIEADGYNPAQASVLQIYFKNNPSEAKFSSIAEAVEFYKKNTGHTFRKPRAKTTDNPVPPMSEGSSAPSPIPTSVPMSTQDLQEAILNFLKLNPFASFTCYQISEKLGVDNRLCFSALESLSSRQQSSKTLKTVSEKTSKTGKQSTVTLFRYYPFALVSDNPVVNVKDLKTMIRSLLFRGECASPKILETAIWFFGGVRRQLVFETLKNLTDTGEISYAIGRKGAKFYTLCDAKKPELPTVPAVPKH